MHEGIYPATSLLLTFFPAFLLFALAPALVAAALLPRLRVGVVAVPSLVATLAVSILHLHLHLLLHLYLLLLLVVLPISTNLRRRLSRRGASSTVAPAS